MPQLTFKPISFSECLSNAINSPNTVASAMGAQLHAWFAPILALKFNKFCLDSRKLAATDGFILLKSASQSAQHIDNAKRYLAAADGVAGFIISEYRADELGELDVTTPIVYVPDIRTVLGDLIAARLQLARPAPLPQVVAVTGTNGKTTVSQLIAQLCELSGQEVAIMGTAGNGRLGALTQAANTTGDVLMVHEFLHQMAMDGVTLVALEASSHGLDQYRLQGVPVIAAVYTNLSHDHLDYHATMDEYRDAKARLFSREFFPKLTLGVVNADAKYPLFDYDMDIGYQLIKTSQADSQADIYVTAVHPSLAGVGIDALTPQGILHLDSPLLGLFNVDNLLASVAVYLGLGGDFSQTNALVKQLQGARGRMQRAPSQVASFIVDYAHTPDALEQVLSSLRRHCTGRLVAVFGCGGDRDRTKRPLMTEAGLSFADHIILTADNPRSENPADILKDMQAGLSDADHDKITIEPDRAAAIKLAVNAAADDDIIVIAGKGHETYQEISGVRHDFDDMQVLMDAIKAANK